MCLYSTLGISAAWNKLNIPPSQSCLSINFLAKLSLLQVNLAFNCDMVILAFVNLLLGYASTHSYCSYNNVTLALTCTVRVIILLCLRPYLRCMYQTRMYYHVTFGLFEKFFLYIFLIGKLIRDPFNIIYRESS